MSDIRSNSGYTLIELVVVLVIVAIIATIALKSLTTVTETGRYEATKAELELLAHAIAGDPSQISGGGRADFGYVGDVGSLPPNLDALVSNPGGFATWKGPYLNDNFSDGGGSSHFAQDAWGVDYTYTAGAMITSVGGPSQLTRQLANSAADLLYNGLSVVVTDLDRTPPGTIYRDSVRFVLTRPNGTGGTTTTTKYPQADGLAIFDSVPVGRHWLATIYMPTADTLRRLLTVNPGRSAHAEISLPEDVWTGN